MRLGLLLQDPLRESAVCFLAHNLQSYLSRQCIHREPVSAFWQRAADRWLLLSLVFTNSPTSVSMGFNQSQMNSCGLAWVSFCSVFGMFLPELTQPAWIWLTFITSGLCMIKQNFIAVDCIILPKNSFLCNTK